MVECFTCSKEVHYREAHLGHWKHGKLDFHPYATQIQCVTCNLWKHGRLDVYTLRLIELLGVDEVRTLARLSNTHPGYTEQQLKDVIQKYGRS